MEPVHRKGVYGFQIVTEQVKMVNELWQTVVIDKKLKSIYWQTGRKMDVELASFMQFVT